MSDIFCQRQKHKLLQRSFYSTSAVIMWANQLAGNICTAPEERAGPLGGFTIKLGRPPLTPKGLQQSPSSLTAGPAANFLSSKSRQCLRDGR